MYEFVICNLYQLQKVFLFDCDGVNALRKYKLEQEDGEDDEDTF